LATFTSAFGTELKRLDDGSILSGGTAPEKEVITVTLRGPHPPITALRLDLLTDDSLPVKGPGRAHNGNLHLSEFDARVFPASGEPATVTIARASADFNQESWTIQHALDGNPATAWGIHPEEGRPHHAVFVLAAPVVLGTDDTLAISLRQIHGGAHVIGRFRLSATSGDPDAAIALPAAAEEALAIPAATRTRAQQASIASAILASQAHTELKKLPAPHKLYAAATTAVNERGTIVFPAPREIHVLKRGDLDKPQGLVGPGALSAIPGLPSRFEFPAGTPESARRAALADWFVDERNPLTWRSIANRVWQWHFGRGLCDTPGDFGRMGGTPSHPELLDWLAAEIRRTGSLKAIHRLICTSAAYRRSSEPSPELFARDPDNRLLARMSPHRLDAESFYDGILHASGRLDDTRGGPAVAHFSQRPGAQLTPILDYDAFDWDSPRRHPAQHLSNRVARHSRSPLRRPRLPRSRPPLPDAWLFSLPAPGPRPRQQSLRAPPCPASRPPRRSGRPRPRRRSAPSEDRADGAVDLAAPADLGRDSGACGSRRSTRARSGRPGAVQRR
jgi:hypothetical protein